MTQQQTQASSLPSDASAPSNAGARNPVLEVKDLASANGLFVNGATETAVTPFDMSTLNGQTFNSIELTRAGFFDKPTYIGAVKDAIVMRDHDGRGPTGAAQPFQKINKTKKFDLPMSP